MFVIDSRHTVLWVTERRDTGPTVELLGARGINLQPVADVETAVTRATAVRSSAVVVDLAARCARTLLERRLQGGPLHLTPVIAITSHDDEVDAHFTARFRIAAVLSAPHRPARLLDELLTHIRRPGSAAQDKQRVLVVDDDRAIVLGLTVRLKAAGYEVTCAVDGRGALAQARSSNPHVVILDLGLPFADGFEVMEQLARYCPSARVIVHTGRDPSVVRDRALKAGAFRFLRKPADNVEMMKAVEAAAGAWPVRSAA